jgi:hypothetical protein
MKMEGWIVSKEVEGIWLGSPLFSRYNRSCSGARFCLFSRTFPIMLSIQNDAPRSVRISVRNRCWLALAGTVLITPLVIAAWLRPSPLGMGTHQQLGLPPCTLVTMFGIRCPSCGMTTSWSHFVRGQWVQSLQANVGGCLLAAIAAVSGGWMLLSAASGRRLAKTPSEGVLAAGAVFLVLITLADWVVRLTFR